MRTVRVPGLDLVRIENTRVNSDRALLVFVFAFASAYVSVSVSVSVSVVSVCFRYGTLLHWVNLVLFRYSTRTRTGIVHQRRQYRIDVRIRNEQGPQFGYCTVLVRYSYREACEGRAAGQITVSHEYSYPYAHDISI